MWLMRTNDIKYAIFIVFPVLIYAGYALSRLGIHWINTAWLHTMLVAFHVILCMFLMIRFRPWSTVQLHPHDSGIIFGAAVLLLTNVVFLEISSYVRLPAAATMVDTFIKT
jgi:hypothetical protein